MYTYVYLTGVNISCIIYGIESSAVITKAWQYRQLNWKSVTFWTLLSHATWSSVVW